MISEIVFNVTLRKKLLFRLCTLAIREILIRYRDSERSIYYEESVYHCFGFITIDKHQYYKYHILLQYQEKGFINQTII